jgi:hypothetical protein
MGKLMWVCNNMGIFGVALEYLDDILVHCAEKKKLANEA